MDELIPIDILEEIADRIAHSDDRYDFNSPYEAYGKIKEEHCEAVEDIYRTSDALRNLFDQICKKRVTTEDEALQTGLEIKGSALLAAKEMIQVAAMAERHIKGITEAQGLYPKFFLGMRKEKVDEVDDYVNSRMEAVYE